MRQSNEIVRQVLDKMPGGAILADDPKVVYPPKEKLQESIESLIHHFHLASEGFPAPKGEVYASIESPKGELGFYLVSDGTNKPWRFRVRPPSFVNLSALSHDGAGKADFGRGGHHRVHRHRSGGDRPLSHRKVRP